MLQSELHTEKSLENTVSAVSARGMRFVLSRWRQNIRQYTMLLALVSIWLVFAFLTDSLFLSPRNLSNLFLQSATTATLAIGMTLVLVAGHLDLSVGSVAGFTGAVAAVLQLRYSWPTSASVAVALAAGVLIGLWQGYWVAYKRIPAFIVTLASMIAFRGAILGITGGQTLSPLNDNFKTLGQGYIPSLLFRSVEQVDASGKALLDEYGDPISGFQSLFSQEFIAGEHPPFNDMTALIALLCIGAFVYSQRQRRQSKRKYGLSVLPLSLEALRVAAIALAIGGFFAIMTFYMGLPYAVLIVFILGLIFSLITQHTPFGRHLYAMGGNLEAAKLSGIPVQKRVLAVFTLMGALTAIAGLILAARLNAATTSAGQNFELDAISAAIIGGTSTMGGVGTIFGSLVGALVMASLDNGMSLMNVDITWQYIVKGSILLGAVWVDIATRKPS